MAEEITYIPYGQDEISQQDLMTNLANGVEDYLGSKHWARKEKYRNAWLKAYQEIINRGLTGASNDSGVWRITHNGDDFPIETMSNLDKEMYQDAAFYIQQQMAKMTPKSKEEEKKKDELIPFKFKESFLKQLLNNRYGGDSSLFDDPETGWNTLDVRNEKTGLRGTEKRREAMISELQKYLETIEDGKFNFEGTSFANEEDARTKIQTAINALKDTPEDESDDIPAFNALGLKYRGFFSNGGNDIYGTVGDKQVTYQQYYDLLRQEEEAKTKKEKEVVQAKLQKAKEMAQQLRNRLNPFRKNNNNVKTLTPEQMQEQKKNMALQHKWGEGLTDDMIADLTALGLDSVSAGAAFAPGYGTAVSAVSGIGATLAGAYADRARGESWGSTLSTAGTGLLMDAAGLIPGLGIAGKIGKMARVVSKAAKWMGPALQIYSAAAFGPGAISAFNKFTSGKKDEITSQELRDFTYAMRAIAAGGIRKAGSTYQQNRTLKKALVGVDSPGAPKTNGKPRATITNETTSPSITVKGKKYNLTDDEFKTLSGNSSRESKIKILKEKGINESDIEWQGINLAKGRVKPASKSSKLQGLQKGSESGQLKWNTTAADYKGFRRFSNENFLRNYSQLSSPSTGMFKWLKDRWNGDDILNRASVSTGNNTQQNVFNTEQKLLPLIKQKYTTPESTSQDIIPMSRSLPQPGGTHKGTVVDNVKTGSLSRGNITLGEANQEFNDFHRMYIASTVKNSKVPSKPFGNGYGTSKEPENGSLTFGDMTATLTKLGNNKGFSITFGKTNDTVIAKQYKDIQQLRSNFAKQLNPIIKKQSNIKETAALLRQFKAKGWLKYGGQINPYIDTVIEDFFKNNNI